MDDFNSIIKGARPVLVDAHAEWCGPCKAMSPIIQELAHELSGRVRVLKVDVDRNPMFARQYRINGVPTLLLFKNGAVVWRQSGVMSAAHLTKAVEAHLSDASLP